MPLTLPILDHPHFAARFNSTLTRESLTTLQINIGRRCNLACNHCHVESSPSRTGEQENMSRETAERLVAWAVDQGVFKTVDFTGGSPEMNDNFRWMVEAFAGAGLHIITRCNPTLIDYAGWKGEQEDYSWIPGFFAQHRVEVIASMPCYLDVNVDAQRGNGAYDASISGLQQLNAVGYGSAENLVLNLIYNPVGPILPPAQCALEDDYKRELKERFGIVFNTLLTMTNMPIKRWRHELERDGKLESYMNLLIEAFNTDTLAALMCRHHINVGPDGRMYDCDFNQALDLELEGRQGARVWDMTADDLIGHVIATADHCYGCTAGAGSSCGGSLL
ncbi:MAG: radical SAM/Cys-rich domain protein [Planctomycetes bacterium]|nr:radical SAM/Cys-rich domain protein [Planctomycetota bacterium]NOG53079.1 radical SAM/Cys-rich domain protein [Planctomycetota bacterium]